MEAIARTILDAVARIDPEKRYEEKACRDGGTRVSSTNEALREELNAPRGQVNYPARGDLCDIVCTIAERKVWLEVKHSWTWKTYRNPGTANPSLEKHLLGVNAKSALDDARVKLPRLLGNPCAEVIGLLVIALDSDRQPYRQEGLDALARAGGMDQRPWQRFERPRWGSRVPGYESIGVQPVLWLRPTAVEVVTER